MGSVEIVLGQRTMWRILFLIFITFFFLFMLMFFYKSDVRCHSPSFSFLIFMDFGRLGLINLAVG